MQKSNLSNKIRRLRFEKNEMTQQELARLVGVTRQTINTIEANKYSPSLALAFRIARIFGVGVEDVFQFIESSDSNPTLATEELKKQEKK